MAVLCKLSRYSRACGFVSKNPFVIDGSCNRAFRTVVEQPKKSSGLLKISLIGAGIGALIGTGYSLQKVSRDRQNLALDGKEIEIKTLKHKPPVPASRTVRLSLVFIYAFEAACKTFKISDCFTSRCNGPEVNTLSVSNVPLLL